MPGHSSLQGSRTPIVTPAGIEHFFRTQRLLHPGAERLIFFHLVVNGRCWVSSADGERYWASGGEVFVFPYGDTYLMGGVEPAAPVPITSVLAPPPWNELPVNRHGEGGSSTDVVCGFLYSDDPLFDPTLRAFPPRLRRATAGGARKELG